MSDDNENPYLKFRKQQAIEAGAGAVTPPADFNVAPGENPYLKFKSQSAKPLTEEPAKPETPEYQGSTLADVGKSIGTGFKEGVLGVATMPGNLEQLARIGIDKGAGLFGYDPGLSSGKYAMPTDAAHPGKHTTILPTLSDIEQGLESHGQGFYQPKTTAGQYADTISSFIPMAFGGEASIPARIARVAGAGAASETAGQITKDTDFEGPARFLGAVLGHRLPRGAVRLRTPVANVDPVLEGQMQELNARGITPLSGDATGHKFIKNLESSLRETPFGGNPAEQAYHRVMADYTRSALAEAGAPYEDALRAGPAALRANRDRIGRNYDALSSRNEVPLDDTTMGRINAAVADYNGRVGHANRAPIIGEIHSDLTQQSAMPGANWNPTMDIGGGTLDGRQYQSMRTKLLELQDTKDPDKLRVVRGIRHALDDSAMANASPEDAALWRQNHEHYRNQVALEDAMAGASEDTNRGYVTPTKLQQAIKMQEGKRSWSLGRGTGLQDLARAGGPLKPAPNSGSPGRMMALHLFTSLPAAGAAAMASGSPWPLLGAVGAPILHAAASRTLFSPAMQRWLSNRVQAPRIGRYDRGTLPFTTRAAISAKGAYARPDQETDQ